MVDDGAAEHKNNNAHLLGSLTCFDGAQRNKDIAQGCGFFPGEGGLGWREDGGGVTQSQLIGVALGGRGRGHHLRPPGE